MFFGCVKKFGGTSLANTHCIQNVADMLAQDYQRQAEPFVVVVSAMAGATDELSRWVYDVGQDCQNLEAQFERDVVLSSGENITAGLLSLALQKKGIPARSFLAWQLPVETDQHPTLASIQNIVTQPLHQAFEEKKIPVVAGFQGMTSCQRITTLGRGGSDTSAVALAAFLNSRMCQIYTDVDGVYSLDPKLSSSALHYENLDYETACIMSRYGAKVLHHEAAQWAKAYNIPVQIASTFGPKDKCTWIKNISGSFPAMTCQPVLAWSFADLSQQEMLSLQDALTRYRVVYFDWRFSQKGLHCFTLREALPYLSFFQNKIQKPQPFSLISLIHMEEDYARIVQTSFPVHRFVHLEKALGIVVESSQTAEAISFFYPFVQEKIERLGLKTMEKSASCF